ncbi:Acg family FMN-binding oxidoreductase [Halobaculum marinum]|uniref:Acg family FMN-binding oxidoreductase n=1 Tax=Halobaculum marinum TaxID=3031996 RepID=A0ABD5X2H3_9EURY|nr:nitroreductase family protein [Halobaculum sp. DT55]
MDPADLTTDVWDVDAADFPAEGTVEEQVRFLLRYAVLAPSSHNAQPWSFGVDDCGTVTVRGVDDRWLREADPDRREFHLSLGCAVETLRIAARRFGLGCRAVTPAEGAVVARVEIGPGGNPPLDADLFDQITERYTDHRPFQWTPVPTPVLENLRAEAAEFDVAVRIVREERPKRSLAELQANADRAQMTSPAYRRELGRWIGMGALGDSWLAARIGRAAVTQLNLGGREARRNSALIESAPVVAVLSTGDDERPTQVATGRAFQRMALAASAAGLAVHPMSQILERPDDRERLRELLDLDGRPQHLFRLGAVDGRQPHTPRWPAESVTVDGGAPDDAE